ncbi:MAG: phosphotransferase [Clostridium sp.]|nr:phosphotransferase [Clostridium sp.]
MNCDYIIVQAGGKGTRMKHLTLNKPKALVPIDNLPMIFHLFKKYPNKQFIIIGDYLFDVLERYLKTFAQVNYTLVNAAGTLGTCGGLVDALSLIPEKAAFMLIWSDLLLSESFLLPEKDGNYIGISKGFTCRWRYKDNQIQEIPSNDSGIAGLFIFQDKYLIHQTPKNGEFVRWLSQQNIAFKELPLQQTKEFGLITEYEKLPKPKCRPFNQLKIEGNIIIKEGIDDQGKQLALRERAWYEKLKDYGFEQLPQIYSLEPLVMERIQGKNVYEYNNLTHDQKKSILEKIINALNRIHSLESCPTDAESYYIAYIKKTFQRLEKVFKLVPYAQDEYILINGKKCPNVFYMREALEKMIQKYIPDKFCLLHGDNTFSNILLTPNLDPIFIDPRGYFGNTEFCGDPAYDWAKLYYSIMGNYDQFNQKHFGLEINQIGVSINISSNNWEDTEDIFFELLEGQVTSDHVKLLHAIIWLSLTTYAWEDYDSICGAFYKGLLCLEEIL